MSGLQTKVARRTVLAAVPAIGAIALRRETRASAPVRVRFAFFGDAAEQVAYDHVIDAFEAANPEIGVERIAIASANVPPMSGVPSPGGYPTWLQTAFTSDSPPDVFLIGYRDIGRYALRGAIEPLDAYLEASPSLQEKDFYVPAMDAFRTRELPGNGIGAIPQNASSLVVYYNTELFEQEGVAEPADDWTWADFAETADRLTLDRNGNGKIDVHGLAMEPSLSRYAAFIWGAGGEIFDDLIQPTNLVFDTAEARDGINWLTSLGKSGLKVTPSEASSRTLDDTRRFAAGKAAMLVQSRRVVSYLRENATIPWDVAPLPVGKSKANVLHSDGLAMWSGAHDKAAAWDFIEFAMGPVGQTILAESGRTVPSLKSVAESDTFLKGTSLSSSFGIALPPGRSQVFLDNIAFSRPLPSAATWAAAVRECDAALKYAFYADGDVDRAVARAIRRSKPAFETASDFRKLTWHIRLPESED